MTYPQKIKLKKSVYKNMEKIIFKFYNTKKLQNFILVLLFFFYFLIHFPIFKKSFDMEY